MATCRLVIPLLLPILLTGLQRQCAWASSTAEHDTMQGRVESCHYHSIHAHELAVHTHRTFRVDCSSAVLLSGTTKWSLPTGCTAVDAAPAPTIIDVTCTTPGLKKFEVVGSSRAESNGTRAQLKVYVTHTNLCHDWFVAQVYDDVPAD